MGLPVFAFNKDAASFPPFDMIDTMPVPVFHTIWLEDADFEGDSITTDAIYELLAVDNAGSSQIYEGAGQIHFSFDIYNTGFSRIILLKNSLNPDRVGSSILNFEVVRTRNISAFNAFWATQWQKPNERTLSYGKRASRANSKFK